MVMSRMSLLAAAALASATFACAEDPKPGAAALAVDGGLAPAKSDAARTATDSAGDAAQRQGEASSAVPTVECCPPSPQPNCCMDYGGAKLSGGCGKKCDGMPVPSDPAWRLVKDEYGCPRWSSQGSTATCCGSKPLPGGVRAFSCYGDYGEPPVALDPRAAAASIAESVRECASDADCCVVHDGCRAEALVVASAGRDSVRQLLDDAPADQCVKCVAPRVQVACVAGVCVGAKVSFDAGVVVGVGQDHCGTLDAAPTQAWQRAPLGCGTPTP